MSSNRRLVIGTLCAACATFCIVQDRVTYRGTQRYVSMQREAIAGRGTPVTIDHVMQPTVARSVQLGLASGASVLIGGFGIVYARARRR